MLVCDLGRIEYRAAWQIQEQAHAAVLAGGEEQLLLVEHPPIITFGRRAAIEGRKHLLASQSQLQTRGIDLIDSDRGGDVTYHGPGQIVAYPILKLNDHRLSVGAYVRALEHVVIDTLQAFGIAAQKDDCAIGVWVRRPGDRQLAKICALGVRIRRGVTLHGIALNVETDLADFDLIVPCGLKGRPVTSVRELLGNATPAISAVKETLIIHARKLFDSIPAPDRR